MRCWATLNWLCHMDLSLVIMVRNGLVVYWKNAGKSELWNFTLNELDDNAQRGIDWYEQPQSPMIYLPQSVCFELIVFLTVVLLNFQVFFFHLVANLIFFTPMNKCWSSSIRLHLSALSCFQTIKIVIISRVCAAKLFSPLLMAEKNKLVSEMIFCN